MQVLTDPANEPRRRARRSGRSRSATCSPTPRGFGYTIITKGPLLGEYNRLGLTPGRSAARVSRAHRRPRPRQASPNSPTASRRLPLIADPGERWSYSVSLDLLGRVIEVASGKPFDARSSRTDRSGRSGCSAPSSRCRRPRCHALATNYFVTPHRPIPIDPARPRSTRQSRAFPFGGAGLVSSARDYDRFLAMLLGEGAARRRRSCRPRDGAPGDVEPASRRRDDRGHLCRGDHGFGAGGRVSLADTPGGPGAGTFGWGGAAGTIGWADPQARRPRRRLCTVHARPKATRSREDVGKAVYADLA